MKDNLVALRIKYYVLGTGDNHFEDEKGLAEFKQEIHNEYISSFEIELADRGGFSNFVIEFLLDITLKDYLLMVAGGLAWDTIKYGSKQLFIRPFINLYQKFRRSQASQKIQEITFIFNDSRILIRSIHQISYEIDFQLLGKIFSRLSLHYEKFEVGEGHYPLEIDIPLIEDILKRGTPTYRYILSVDEPYVFEAKPKREFSEADYFKFWGLRFLGWQKYIYKVESSELVSNNWSTEDDYFRDQNRNS